MGIRKSKITPSINVDDMLKKVEISHETETEKLDVDKRLKEICEIKDDEFYLFEKKFNGKVIYTGQIDELFNCKFGELPYRSVDMKFETINKKKYQEAGTVNYPNNYDFTRITEFKYIHPSNSEKTTILKEYPQEYIKDVNTPYYPIFTDKNQCKFNQYVEYSKRFDNLILLGRLAEYKYYDMDDMVERALEVFEKEILNG
jgi:UDP-galactopyranose mutase